MITYEELKLCLCPVRGRLDAEVTDHDRYLTKYVELYVTRSHSHRHFLLSFVDRDALWI